MGSAGSPCRFTSARATSIPISSADPSAMRP
jgi:hypothetical protein